MVLLCVAIVSLPLHFWPTRYHGSCHCCQWWPPWPLSSWPNLEICFKFPITIVILITTKYDRPNLQHQPHCRKPWSQYPNSGMLWHHIMGFLRAAPLSSSISSSDSLHTLYMRLKSMLLQNPMNHHTVYLSIFTFTSPRCFHWTALWFSSFGMA